MSVNNICICPITIECVGPITAHRFVTAAGLMAGAGENTIGVAAQTGADEPLTVDNLGIIQVEAGGAISADAPITPDAQARAVARTTSGAIVARSIDAATAAGQRIRVALIPN